jgi:hypothetical protein
LIALLHLKHGRNDDLLVNIVQCNLCSSYFRNEYTLAYLPLGKRPISRILRLPLSLRITTYTPSSPTGLLECKRKSSVKIAIKRSLAPNLFSASKPEIWQTCSYLRLKVVCKMHCPFRLPGGLDLFGYARSDSP